jgi:hypothetical protein
MKAKSPIQKHSVLFTRFALICGCVITVTCGGPAALALEDSGHHPHKTLYTFGVNGSVSAPLLNLLSVDYSIVDADNLTPQSELKPALIGPDALANQDVTAYLVQAYRAGLTIAIANATQEQVNLFDELVEGELTASCRPARGAPQIALYAVQRTTREQPEEVSRFCLPTVFRAGAASDASDEQGVQAGDSQEQWVSAAFAPQPPPPPLQPLDDPSASSLNLDELSGRTRCSVLSANPGGVVQDDHFVTSARAFDDLEDFYYVQDFPKFTPNTAQRLFTVGAGTPFLRVLGNGKDQLLDGTSILFSQPSTSTEFISQYINNRTTTVSGSVGFTGKSLNISASKVVTVGTTTTVNTPPVTILNRANLVAATTRWDFSPRNPIAHTLFDPSANWVWAIKRDVYGNAPNDVREVVFPTSASAGPTTATSDCSVKAPFTTFEITAPVITSVDPATVQGGGGDFLIRGAQMYPGILSSVLLGGDALPTPNVVSIDDTVIRVVVPGNQRKGSNAVQVNTTANGRILPSNSNISVNVQ